jgi:hypothetical protein
MTAPAAADRHVFWTQSNREAEGFEGQHADDEHRLLQDDEAFWSSDDGDEDSDLIVYGREADSEGDDGDNSDATEARQRGDDATTTLLSYGGGGGGDEDEASAGGHIAPSSRHSARGNEIGDSGGDDNGSAYSFPGAQPVVVSTADNATENSEDDDQLAPPRAEASNDAPANFLVGSGRRAAAPEEGAAAAQEEEGRSLDIARSATGDLAHRIIISQHILRDSGAAADYGGSSLTLQIGSGGGRGGGPVLDISNMVAIAVGVLGFLLLVCGRPFFCKTFSQRLSDT